MQMASLRLLFICLFLVSSSSLSLKEHLFGRVGQIEFQRHNQLRAKHRSPRLVFDYDLFTKAQQYADSLGYIEVTIEMQGKTGYGKNVYQRIPDVYRAPDATNSWYNEIQSYDFDNPGLSPTTEHFTQLIWYSTTKVGFGFSERYVVAFYYLLETLKINSQKMFDVLFDQYSKSIVKLFYTITSIQTCFNLVKIQDYLPHFYYMQRTQGYQETTSEQQEIERRNLEESQIMMELHRSQGKHITFVSKTQGGIPLHNKQIHSKIDKIRLHAQSNQMKRAHIQLTNQLKKQQQLAAKVDKKIMGLQYFERQLAKRKFNYFSKKMI